MSQGATLAVQTAVKIALTGLSVEEVALQFDLDVSYVRDLDNFFNKKTSAPVKEVKEEAEKKVTKTRRKRKPEA